MTSGTGKLDCILEEVCDNLLQFFLVPVNPALPARGVCIVARAAYAIRVSSPDVIRGRSTWTAALWALVAVGVVLRVIRYAADRSLWYVALHDPGFATP